MFLKPHTPRPHRLRPTRRAVLAGLALLLGPALGAHALFSHSLLQRAHVLRPAGGSTDVVTSTADDGSSGTLRSVLANAADGDTITFDPGTFGTAQTITLNGAELATALNVTIQGPQGPGANLLTIDAGGNSRVFDFTNGSATDAISNLTITNGTDSADGNGGGGVLSQGPLTVTDCAFTNSTASYGGGLVGNGPLTLTGSAFTGDTSPDESGGVYVTGGATITNCTFANDSAPYAGGLDDEGSAPVTVTSCTFANDSATGGQNGGGIFEDGSSLTVTSSLFAGSTGGDVVNYDGATITSGGSNLLGDASPSGFNAPGANDQFGVTPANALIGSLASNGGPTPTCALLPGSPAIDADYSSGTSVDQRGVSRPQGARNDIGAYEAGTLTSLAVTPASPSVAAGLTQQFTATATYSDGTTADVTSSVTWASDDTTVATIDATGLATGVSQGTANVTATVGGVTSNSDALTVTAPVLASIAVSPASAAVAAGLTDQLTVTATYSDGSTADVTASSTFTADASGDATINATGLVTGVTASATPVVLTAGKGGQTATASVTVTAPVLQSIAVTPASPSVAEGLTQQFTARATYSDASTADVTGTSTWSSDATGVATINASGLATGVRYGTAHVTASLSGVTSPADTLTVTHVPVGLVVTNALDDGSAGCLRSVLASSGPGDTITFAASVTGTITLNGTQLAISRNVTIQGPGANVLTVSGNNASSIFRISGGTVHVSGLTVAHGSGAGIVNYGALTATGCTFSSDAGSYGGGILSYGFVTATGCTFSGDTASVSGGGVYSATALSLSNCTFANDTAGSGGAVTDAGSTTASITSCTFSGNTATLGAGHGGGLYENGHGVLLTSSLLVGNTGGDYGGTAATSGGSNLLGDGNGHGFTNGTSHDQTGVSSASAKIGVLASNGGPTQTCAVLAGSPAIGGDYANPTATDQRGVSRTTARHTIGAYEYVAPTVTSIVVTPSSPSVAKGLARQFTATATYSDASTADVTGSATWSSDDHDRRHH